MTARPQEEAVPDHSRRVMSVLNVVFVLIAVADGASVDTRTVAAVTLQVNDFSLIRYNQRQSFLYV